MQALQRAHAAARLHRMAQALLRGYDARRRQPPSDRDPWLVYASMVAARLIEPGACFCRVQCAKECETLLRWSRVPEPRFRETAFDILEANYHTRDLHSIAQIRAALRLTAALVADLAPNPA